jgi:hypothetical protein
MFKKVFIAVTAMVMMAISMQADTATVNGITWTYTVSGGKASIYNDGFSAIPETTTGAITIPSSLGGYPVTSIGDGAFFSCSGLTSVMIPNSVTSIGEGAFFSCSGITSVTIPNSVTSIERGAFMGCSGLTSVMIPNSVTSIGGGAFWNCSGLTSVMIPNSVTSIGGGAFFSCSGLTSVMIPNSVTSIGEEAFKGCSPSIVFKVLEVQALLGDADAQCKLGKMYENGRGVAQDYAEAVKWYRKSAEQGNDFAKRKLNELSNK